MVITSRSVDGTRVSVHDLGGTGEAAFLVHGVGLHGLMFAPLARVLAQRFHCFAIDLRGHGCSGAPPSGDFSWSRLAEDVAAGVEATGARRPVGIVHSAGGTAALRAEAGAPGTFSILYCFEPVMRTSAMREEITVEHPLVAQALRRKATFASRAEARERYRDRAPFDTITDEALSAYVDHGLIEQPDGTFVLACRPEYEAALYLAGVGSDLYEHAGDIACPVTVATGAAPANTLGPAFAAATAAAIDGARLVTFEHLGHLGPFEDPDAVAASVCEAIGTPAA